MHCNYVRKKTGSKGVVKSFSVDFIPIILTIF